MQCMAQCTSVQAWTIGCGSGVGSGQQCTRVADKVIDGRSSELTKWLMDRSYLVPWWWHLGQGRVALCSRHYYYVQVAVPLAWAAVVAATVYAGNRAWQAYSDGTAAPVIAATGSGVAPVIAATGSGAAVSSGAAATGSGAATATTTGSGAAPTVNKRSRRNDHPVLDQRAYGRDGRPSIQHINHQVRQARMTPTRDAVMDAIEAHHARETARQIQERRAAGRKAWVHDRSKKRKRRTQVPANAAAIRSRRRIAKSRARRARREAHRTGYRSGWRAGPGGARRVDHGMYLSQYSPGWTQ